MLRKLVVSRRTVPWILGLPLGAAALFAAQSCSSTPPPTGQAAGCSIDSDCSGKLICAFGSCPHAVHDVEGLHGGDVPPSRGVRAPAGEDVLELVALRHRAHVRERRLPLRLLSHGQERLFLGVSGRAIVRQCAEIAGRRLRRQRRRRRYASRRWGERRRSFGRARRGRRRRVRGRRGRRAARGRVPPAGIGVRPARLHAVELRPRFT
jgi:hypothetical protein